MFYRPTLKWPTPRATGSATEQRLGATGSATEQRLTASGGATEGLPSTTGLASSCPGCFAEELHALSTAPVQMAAEMMVSNVYTQLAKAHKDMSHEAYNVATERMRTSFSHEVHRLQRWLQCFS